MVANAVPFDPNELQRAITLLVMALDLGFSVRFRSAKSSSIPPWVMELTEPEPGPNPYVVRLVVRAFYQTNPAVIEEISRRIEVVTRRLQQTGLNRKLALTKAVCEVQAAINSKRRSV